MYEKSTKIKYKRNKKSTSSSIEALTNAQRIAFGPFSFQIVAAMLEFRILQSLDEKPLTKEQITKVCNISDYCADTLFDAALCIGLVEKNKNNTYSNTKLAEAFLFDEMTRVNFNFMKDVCYLGADELINSLKENRPAGLQKYYFDSQTIYPKLPVLPEKMKQSWYEFDHHYSDDCFKEVLTIMFEKNPKLILDIGGNTGKFEKACLQYDDDCKIAMVDLPENIETAKNNVNDKRCKFFATDILSSNPLPDFDGEIPDIVFMSQFLDCFSKEQILFILNKISKSISDKTRIYILEPLIDNQRFEGASYALSHISLYFTCMANGNSKMYNESDLKEIISRSDLKLQKAYYNIGKYDYTLLECTKK